MKNKINIVFVIVCIGIVSIIGSFSIIADDQAVSQLENRKLMNLPQYTADKLVSGEFFNDYENYSLDQMVGREKFINSLNCIKIAQGKKLIGGIILADNGILLKKNNYETIINKVSWQNSLLVANSMKKVKNAADSYGGKTIYMHAMHQNEFYKDNLPNYYTSLVEKYDEYNTSLLKDVSDTGVTVVDCNPVLKEHADEYLYFKTDHHWTTKGAYYAYTELVKALDKNIEIESWDQLNVTKVEKTFLGSLSSQIGSTYFLDDDYFEYAISLHFPKYSRKSSRNSQLPQRNSNKLFQDNGTEYSKYGDIEQTDYALDIFYTDRPYKKDILIIGYSYKEALIPYALNDFNRVMTLDPRTYDGDISEYIKSAKADYVVVLRDDLWEGNHENIAVLN